MRNLLLGALTPLLLLGCDSIQYVVQENVTGLNVTVTFETELALDQLQVMGQTINGNPAFEPALLPEEAQEIEGSQQTFTILVPSSMGESPLRITILGYSGGAPVAAGFAETVLKAEQLVWK